MRESEGGREKSAGLAGVGSDKGQHGQLSSPVTVLALSMPLHVDS